METKLHKFSAIQYLEDILRHYGLSRTLTDLITFAVACAILALFLWLANFLITKLLISYIKRAAARTKTLWDDYLYKRKFFHRSIRIIPAFALLYFVKIIFQGYDPGFINVAEIIIKCTIIVLVILSIAAFLDAFNDVYDERSTQKSIKGFVQTAKIFVYLLGAIAMISFVFREDPSKIFLGLGASAAIITLIFKDTILGFIASIQLSGQDMIRKGDWITVPTQNADGVVREINLSTVKVLNWDNTVTMVPIYSLVTGSFTNWRSMQESLGRRLQRQLYIDVSSVRILTTAEIDAIRKNTYIAEREALMMITLPKSNTSKFVTNIGLYRSYIEAYVKTHPNINRDIGLGVRYLPHTDNGLILEIHAFSQRKDSKGYDRTIADITEHVVALAPVFGISLFQSPSGRDLGRGTFPEGSGEEGAVF